MRSLIYGLNGSLTFRMFRLPSRVRSMWSSGWWEPSTGRKREFYLAAPWRQQLTWSHLNLPASVGQHLAQLRGSAT